MGYGVVPSQTEFGSINSSGVSTFDALLCGLSCSDSPIHQYTNTETCPVNGDDLLVREPLAKWDDDPASVET